MLVSCVAVLAILSGIPGALAHTWIEQLRTIDDQGKYVGEAGYPRGFKSKFEPGYNSETDMVWLLPPLEQQPPFINSENLLCNPNQRKQEQSDKFPRLQARPGDFIAMRYAENGHVTNPATGGQLDVGRPEKGGSVFIFGTTQPKEDEKIADVLRWTQDGQGGDKRGVLLAVNDYDDGRCYEINPVSKERQAVYPNFAQGQETAGAPGNFPLMCESNAAIPKDAPVGHPYTLYWVWQWPIQPGKNPIYPNGKDEYYTTCMDVSLGDDLGAQKSGTLQFGLEQQDANEEAVKDYRDRKALLIDPIKGELGPVFGNGNSSRSDPSAAPSASPSASVPSAPQQSTLVTITQSQSPSNTGSPAIPTLSTRPGGDNDGAVTVTMTQKVTVVAPTVTVTNAAPPASASASASPAPIGGPSKRDDHAAHHTSKMFRGRWFRE